jgi:hypothetical protein
MQSTADAAKPFVEHVTERAQIGFELLVKFAGQITKLFAAFLRRSSEQDFLDVALGQFVGGETGGDEGLARSGRAGAEGQVLE